MTAKGLGEGVTETGGALEVPYTLPGEVVRAEKHRKQRGVLLELQQSSPHRATPFCDHFGDCGGCLWQHSTYEYQLTLKREFVQRLFDKHGLGASISEWMVHPSDPRQYRNRMDFVWWYDGRFGLRRQGQWRSIVPLSECHLLPGRGMEIALEVNRRVQEAGLPFRDSMRHTPGMRYMVMRHGVFTSEWMLAFVTDDFPLSPGLWEGFPDLVSVYQLVNRDTHNDASDGEPRLLHGADSYRERIAGHEFRVGPRSFFQPNPAVAERMVETLRSWIAPGETRMLDLYCGLGLFSETLADAFEHVDAVEVVEEAIARANAHGTHEHVHYHAADVLEWLGERELSYDTLVIDPPRSGIHPSVRPVLMDSGISHICYVSCNPKVGVQDLSALSSRYEIHQVELFDQFPQTPHVEMLADLRIR